MSSSVEYRELAEQCLQLAEDADSPDTKSVLVMVAAAWHRLAQEREDTKRLVEDIEAAAHRA
jgi:hypothetical protein